MGGGWAVEHVRMRLQRQGKTTAAEMRECLRMRLRLSSPSRSCPLSGGSSRMLELACAWRRPYL